MGLYFYLISLCIRFMKKESGSIRSDTYRESIVFPLQIKKWWLGKQRRFHHMMSSEEDTQCFGFYDNLLISTKSSRRNIVGSGRNSLIVSNNSNSSSSSNISNNNNIKNKNCNRQLVVAAELKNSCYSSIPNFSFRPSLFMKSVSAGAANLYGSLLDQTQSAQFVGGLFGPNGFGSGKMLNEILGRQMKQAQDATSGLPTSIVDNAILTATMESATSVDLFGVSANSSLNSSKLLSNNCVLKSGSARNSSSSSVGGGNVLKSNNEDSISTNSTAIATGQNLNDCFYRLDGGGLILHKEQQQTVINQQQKEQQSDLAHHMLRNILQSKKDLIALDKELRSVINHHRNNNNANTKQNSTSDCSDDFVGNHHLSVTNDKNKNNTNTNTGNTCQNLNSAITEMGLKGSVGELKKIGEDCSVVKIKSEPNLTTAITNIDNIVKNICNTEQKNINEMVSNTQNVLSQITQSENVSTDSILNFPIAQLPDECQQSSATDNLTKKEEEDALEDELMVFSSRSDLDSIGSPHNSDTNDMVDNSKEEPDEETRKVEETKPHKAAETIINPFALDMKRVRVENIVSSIQSSPSSYHQIHFQVNGCKKRKLYQPQQHAMERYLATGLNFGQNMQSLILEENEDHHIESPQIQQKRVQKNALKLQLRTMQEQLAEMQQKYVQLCSRMEKESEYQEVDDILSESMEDDGNHSLISPTLSLANSTKFNQALKSASPDLYLLKQKRYTSFDPSVAYTPPVLTKIMSKIMSAKIHSPIIDHSHFQQTLSSESSVPQHKPEDHNMHVADPTISDTAAMYLDQHFSLQQKIRVPKEAGEQHEMQQQHQQEKEQQEQKEEHLRQKEHQRNKKQQRESQQNRQLSVDVRVLESQATASVANHLLNTQCFQRIQQPHRMQAKSSPQSSIKSEISEKFNMLRSHSSSSRRMSGYDLEGLADTLKSEITASLSALVDTIVKRFVQQRRLLNKQSQTAADQLNKGIVRTSQILDRNSNHINMADQLSSNSSLPTVSSSRVNSVVNNLISSTSGNSLLLNSKKKQTVSFKSSPCNINSTISSHPPNAVLTNNFKNSNGKNYCSIHPAGLRTNVNNLGFTGMGIEMQNTTGIDSNQSDKSGGINFLPPHPTISPSTAILDASKPSQSMTSITAVSLYNSIGIGGSGLHANPVNAFYEPEHREENMEQNEALSLVVTPKKKRHKVTDTRITPRTVSRVLAQDCVVGPNVGQNMILDTNLGGKQSSHTLAGNNFSAVQTTTTLSKISSPHTISHHTPAPPILSVSLPTSVTIPNPSLHESQVFSPYSPFYNTHHGPHVGSNISPAAAQMHHMKISSSPPSLGCILENRGSPPLSHPPTLLHPGLLAAQHRNSPDYSVHLRAALDAQDQSPGCNSVDIQFDGMQPTISFLKQQMM